MPAPRTERATRLSQKTKGPASAATDPDHGPTHPYQEKAVNEQQDNTAPADAASEDFPTSEWLAAQSFEPWIRDKDTILPPSNYEWNRKGEAYLVVFRMCFDMMFRSKEELVSFARAEPELVMKIYEDAITFHEWLKAFTEHLDIAEARLLCVLAVVEQEGWPQ